MFTLILSVIVALRCRPKDRRSGSKWSTVSVIGKVRINGIPTGNIAITATPLPGAEIAYPITTHSKEDGTFEFATNRPADGLPIGTFKLTFNVPSGGSSDQQNGSDSDVERSKHEFLVESGKSLDLGTIELTT